MRNSKDIYLAGIKLKELISKYKFNFSDLNIFLPATLQEVKKQN